MHITAKHSLKLLISNHRRAGNPRSLRRHWRSLRRAPPSTRGAPPPRGAGTRPRTGRPRRGTRGTCRRRPGRSAPAGSGGGRSFCPGRSNLTSQDTNFFDLICQLMYCLILIAYGIPNARSSNKDIPVLLLVPAKCAHEAATSGVNQLLS